MIVRDRKLRILWVGATFASVAAFGQTPGDREERQALLEQAEKAREAEDHPRALSSAIRAGEIRMTPSLRRFIAEEQYAIGDFKESIGNAELCVREAKEAKALNNRRKILLACESLIAELKRSGARIAVIVPDPVPEDARVSVGGKTVPESLYGLPILHRSGEIRVEAEAPGRVPFQRDLVVGPQQEVTVSVVLPPEVNVAPAAPPILLPPVSEQPETVPARAADTKVASTAPIIKAEPERKPSVGPYLLLGAGAVSLGASATFFILRNNTMNTLKRQCLVDPANGTICPDTPSAHSLQRKASTYNALTNVAVGVGGAALLGGAVWLFYERKHKAESSPRIGLQIIPTQEGAVVAISGVH